MTYILDSPTINGADKFLMRKSGKAWNTFFLWWDISHTETYSWSCQLKTSSDVKLEGIPVSNFRLPELPSCHLPLNPSIQALGIQKALSLCTFPVIAFIIKDKIGGALRMMSLSSSSRNALAFFRYLVCH